MLAQQDILQRQQVEIYIAWLPKVAEDRISIQTLGAIVTKRFRRTFKEKFFDALTLSAGGEERPINNNTLRESLKWNIERYNKTKDKLILDGVIYSTRGGPGGAVCLTAPPVAIEDNPIRLFISYSHQDEFYKDELLKHLSPLRRLGKIAAWHDRKIEAGEKWDEAILNNLEHADIVILLISIDFINSDYCYVKELDAALDREATGEVVVVPVIARSCMWKETKFGKYQALPTNGKAIATWGTNDEPLNIVAEGIGEIVDGLLIEKNT